MVVAQVVDKVMAAAAERIPKFPTSLFLRDQLFQSQSVPQVLEAVGLERLVATHTSTELLLLPQV